MLRPPDCNFADSQVRTVLQCFSCLQLSLSKASAKIRIFSHSAKNIFGNEIIGRNGRISKTTPQVRFYICRADCRDGLRWHSVLAVIRPPTHRRRITERPYGNMAEYQRIGILCTLLCNSLVFKQSVLTAKKAHRGGKEGTNKEDYSSCS